jgi:hypothetical protein
MHRYALDYAVGARKVDILKDTKTAAFAAVGLSAADTLVGNNHDFPRQHIPQKLCADCIERAALADRDITRVIRQDAQAERSYSVRVAGDY